MVCVRDAEPGAVLERTAVALTTAVALVGVVVVALVVGLRVANEGAEPEHQNWWLIAWLAVGIVDAVVGATLVGRQGHRRLGSCLLFGGAAAVVVALATQADGYVAALGEGSGWRHITGARLWCRPIAVGVLAALVPWELVLAGRRGRLGALLWWSTAVVIAVAAIGHAADAPRPGPDVVDAATWLVAASATAATVCLVVTWWRAGRWRAEDPLSGWLALGTVAAWLGLVPERFDIEAWRFPGVDVVGPLLLLATVPMLIVGILMRALRERPGRLHGISQDVVGWMAFSGAIVLIYTGAVAGVGRLVGGSAPTWLLVGTTTVVALFADPLRRRVSVAVDRLAFGARDDPLQIVRGVVDHVGVDSGDELLPALAASLQHELRLDSVAIDVRTATGWHRATSIGPDSAHQRTVELEQRGEVVGRLVVGWSHGPFLRARDERVLTALVAPLGLAVGWARLAAQLRRSSVAIVSAREEERRRLRRDLHDGLGPGLTGVSLGLRTAVRQLERSTDAATVAAPRRLLDQTADEVDALIVEVKRIVRDLRPTALDQFGLVAAVGEFVRSFGDALVFEVSVPATDVQLSAAVEAATYRIVTEGVTNVVRHAQATRCWLTIATSPDVDIDIVDDGIGVAEHAGPGVGWTAMRERAEELGGSVRITTRQPHGTHVHVRLPVAVP